MKRHIKVAHERRERVIHLFVYSSDFGVSATTNYLTKRAYWIMNDHNKAKVVGTRVHNFDWIKHLPTAEEELIRHLIRGL